MPARLDGPVLRPPDLRRGELPGQHVEEAGREGGEPRGPGRRGAYVNSLALADYGRPLFIAASADLAESTNIAGFGQDYGGLPGTGWYERVENPTGALPPTEITEFTNAGMMAGLAMVNLAADPFNDFDGYWGLCSTYGCSPTGLSGCSASWPRTASSRSKIPSDNADR